MKQQILKVLAAGSLCLSATTAFATITVEIDLDGNGVGPTQTIDVMDWAPGNALAVAAVPITTTGQTFDLLYQAKLGNLQLGGANVPNPTQQFTIVLGMGEVVTGIAGNAVNFAFNPAGTTNFFEVWAGGANAGDLSGEGFNDGTLVMSGTVTQSTSIFGLTQVNPTVLLDQFGADNWAGQQTVTGIGATQLTASVTPGFINPNYFPNSNPVHEFDITLFNTSQILPFAQVNPSKCFVNAGGGTANSFCDGTANNADPTGQNPNLGAVNGLFTGGPTPEDFIFQADSNMSFDRVAVPEPASLALFGAGLLGMGALRRRRSRKSA